MDLSALNENDRQRMLAVMEERQMKDSLKMYNGLVLRCFSDCITDFTSKSLAGKEETCIDKCADKFMKHSQRVGMRFAELNGAAMQQGGENPEAK